MRALLQIYRAYTVKELWKSVIVCQSYTARLYI